MRQYKAILVGGSFHKTEILIDHKKEFIDMYEPIRDLMDMHTNPLEIMCSPIKYVLLCAVPCQKVETLIYSVDEK